MSGTQQPTGSYDPFDVTGTEIPAQGGPSPDFWHNLLAFGAGTMQGANARTAQGFLANGSGPLGPIGAGLQSAIASSQEMAKQRSGIGLARAQTANLGAESTMHGLQAKQMQQAIDLFNKYINGGAVPGLASGAPGTQPTQTASNDQPPGSDGFIPSMYQRESSLNPAAVNKDTGALGLGQFTAGRLATLGMYNPTEGEDLSSNKFQNFNGTFNIPGFPDVKTKADFLKNPDAQNAVMNSHLADIDQQIAATPGHENFSWNGLRAAAHIGGIAGMQRLIANGGQNSTHDANGTSVGKYYTEFSAIPGGSPAPSQASSAPAQRGFAPLTGSVPYQVAQAGNGPLPGPPAQPPPQQQPQAPLQMNLMPTPAPWNAGVGLGQQAAVMSLNPYTAGFGKPLEAQSQALLGLATAGPKAAATAMNSNIDLRPGGMAMIQTPSGPQWIKNPEHINIMDPGTGAETPAYISPPLPNAPAGSTGEVMSVRTASGGSVTTKLGPGQVKQLEIAPEVTKEAIKEDNEIVTKLRTVPQDSYNAQLSLLQMRPQIDAAAPGAQGQFRNDIKNFVQTWTPGIANALDWNATPGQILNKLTTLSAGKMESEDQGKRGGIGLLQTYMKANPGLELQPEADHDLTNALLITNQYRADHALGAMDFQNKQFQSAQQGGGYHKLSEYDTAFSGTFTPHPYLGAIDALNGKPDWNKGLTTQQQRLAAGVIQRADPNAMIPYQGHMVPIGQWKNVISPTDDVYPISGGKQ